MLKSLQNFTFYCFPLGEDIFSCTAPEGPLTPQHGAPHGQGGAGAEPQGPSGSLGLRPSGSLVVCPVVLVVGLITKTGIEGDGILKLNEHLLCMVMTEENKSIRKKNWKKYMNT